MKTYNGIVELTIGPLAGKTVVCGKVPSGRVKQVHILTLLPLAPIKASIVWGKSGKTEIRRH